MDENLKNWACSFSGCEGGNENADTWLCGIEASGGSDEYYENKFSGEIENGKVEANEKFDWKTSITYPYGRSFAKLYTAINGGNVANYKDVAKLTGDELFKLNLYPISFKSTNHNLWNADIVKATGFENKNLFNTWCLVKRFPFFADIRKNKKPELIICTGVSYLRDFLIFFGVENINEVKVEGIEAKSDKNKRHKRNYYWVKTDGTLLVVIPFFSGSNGLNSHYLLQKMGERIKDLLNN